MARNGKVLVTGATGNVGRQVVSQLRDTGIAVRAMTRNPVAAGFEADVETVRGDLAEPGSIEDCLGGVEAVFLIWPLHSAEEAPAVLDAIKRHAGRVVLLGQGAVPGFGFKEQQRLLAQSGLEWTLIKPSTFAVNALWWVPQIRAGDVVRGAYGALAMPMLHESDIAAVAVRALLDDGHDGKVHTLTGPELLSQAEQVRTIGEAIGRPLRWEELPRAAARRQLLADNPDWPPAFADVLLDTYAVMLTADPAPLTSTVEQLTGVPARTFRQWAIDHAEDFAR